MNSLSELRATRQKLTEEVHALNNSFKNASMPVAVSNTIDNLLNQIEAVDGQLDVVKASADRSVPAWKNENGDDLKVLRNAVDIRNHFAQKGETNRPENNVRLDDFVRGVAGMRSSTAVQNSLSTGTDTSGGYLLPTVVMAEILQALVPASSLLSAGAGILPLEQGAKSFTTVAVDSIPTAAWRLESGTVNMSDPAFRAVVAAPKSLAFYFKISRELLADASNLTAALTIAITQSFARELDRAGLLGSGTAPEPRGIANTPGISLVANGANGAALANYSNFFSGMNSILSLNAPTPTAAIMSPRSLTKLGGLIDTTNQPVTVPLMLQPMRMLTTTAIPNNLTVGTSSDCSQIFLGDFSKLVFAMREQMSIQMLDQTFATTGEVGFMCHCRADVMLQYPAAFAIVNGVRA